MPPEQGDLSRTLTILRISRGWSQDQVAKATGLTNSALSEYERGRKTPEFKNVRKIVSALGYRLSAIDRTEDFLQELRAESLDAGEGAEGSALVPVRGEDDEALRPDQRPLWRKARRVAVQLGQAFTSTSLLLFEILMNRGGGRDREGS